MGGVTLVEIMIVVAILAMTLVVLVDLLKRYHVTFQAQEATINTARSASAIITAVRHALLQANHVLASHSFSGTLYTSGANTLVLSLPAVNSSGDVISGKTDYIVFYVSGANAYVLTEADSASNRVSSQRQLSDVVQTLTFTYDNSDFTQVKKVDTDVETRTYIRTQAIQGHLHQQVYLRNL